METIAKFIKAIFFTEDGNADKTAIQKLKDAVLWILLGAGILIAAICMIPEEESDNSVPTEYVGEE